MQYYAHVKKLFKIKKSSFYPSPKVGSALLALDILPSPSVEVKDEDLMFKIIRQAFSQRRKKAVNPLGSLSITGLGKGEWEKIFIECGLPVSARAETLSLHDYARLADAAISSHH